jgi:SAM-dependent methyltransferase
MTDWYHTWFTDDYLALYPHRDEADAARLVELITRVTGWGAGWRVLDVGCGPGRHAAVVERAGVSYVGLDLSLPLLARARQVTTAPLVRADMRRLPVRAGSVQAVLSLFTSFGYFEHDAEHESTLAGMARALARDGWLVLDFLNAAQVRQGLPITPPVPAPAAAGAMVSKHLSADGRFVMKHITLATGVRHLERVRLFGEDDLRAMLERAGLRIRAAFGDYDGGAPSPSAPRTLLLAQAA